MKTLLLWLKRHWDKEYTQDPFKFWVWLAVAIVLGFIYGWAKGVLKQNP